MPRKRHDNHERLASSDLEATASLQGRPRCVGARGARRSAVQDWNGPASASRIGRWRASQSAIPMTGCAGGLPTSATAPRSGRSPRRGPTSWANQRASPRAKTGANRSSTNSPTRPVVGAPAPPPACAHGVRCHDAGGANNPGGGSTSGRGSARATCPFSGEQYLNGPSGSSRTAMWGSAWSRNHTDVPVAGPGVGAPRTATSPRGALSRRRAATTAGTRSGCARRRPGGTSARATGSRTRRGWGRTAAALRRWAAAPRPPGRPCPERRTGRRRGSSPRRRAHDARSHGLVVAGSGEVSRWRT